MNKKEAIEKSIEHWKHMIEWAKKQPKEDNKAAYIMFSSISENWWSDSCPLCNKYSDECDNCSSCPLKEKVGECGVSEENYWSEVARSSSWGTWVKNAEKFLKQLKILIPKCQLNGTKEE